MLNLFAPGTCTIRAEQTGSTTYLPADAVTRSFEVLKLAQIPLIFDAGPEYQLVNSRGSYGNGGGSTTAPFIAMSQSPTICQVTGREILYRKVGTCVLQGSKEGDALHYPVFKTIRITVYAPARLNVAASIKQIGRVAYSTGGTWIGSPSPSVKYQWFTCTVRNSRWCSPIAGETSSSLTVTSDNAGRFAFLRVFMYQAGFERSRTDSNVIKLSAK